MSLRMTIILSDIAKMLFDVCPKSEVVFIEYKELHLNELQERAICWEYIPNNSEK